MIMWWVVKTVNGYNVRAVLLARKWLCWYWMILCVFVPSKTKHRKNWPCQNWQRFKKRSWGPGLCGSKCIQMSHEKIITIILFHDFTTFLIAKAKASKALVGLVWWAHNPIESPIYPRYSFPIWSSSKVFQLHDPLEPLGLLHLGHAVIGLHGTYPHAQTWRLQIRLFPSPKR